MGIVERRQRHKDEVKKDIICAAWQMVKTDGWQSLSIRKIADAIEYSVPVIYDHFENKEAILIEFGRTGFQLLTEKILEAKSQHADPADQIKAIADAIVEKVQKDCDEKPYHTEGGDQWTLVDYINIVVHIFNREQRQFYDLESLWLDADRMEHND